MKLPPFDYASPTSITDAVALLAAGKGEARLLAGGQSLLPVMAFRLANPALLIDMRKIPDLQTIAVDDRGVRLGALVRWCDIANSPALKKALPLLPNAIEHVAHYAIQTRGTVGGSLGHADPAAEFPGLAVTCDAMIEIEGSAGRREMPANTLFTGPLQTSLGHDDIIVAIRFPPWPADRKWAFEEFSRRHGDFALAAIAVFYDLDDSGRIANAHVGVIAATDKPTRLPTAEAALNGQMPNSECFIAASEAAAQACNPSADIHASADYRRSLVRTLLTRALRKTLN